VARGDLLKGGVVAVLLVAGGLAAYAGMQAVKVEEAALRDAEIQAELESIFAADQRIRDLYLGKIPDTEERTEERLAWMRSERDRLDRFHVDRIQTIVAEVGWPAISRFGPVGSQTACVVAVHAVHDYEFMARSADWMKPLVEAGDLDPECWAQVTDRVLVHAGKPQQFGTQFRGEEIDGVFHWGIHPVADPAQLLARRDAAGLKPYAEYLAWQRADYRIPDSAPPFPDEPVIPGLTPAQTPASDASAAPSAPPGEAP